jgi:hypothetical protein
LIVSLFNSRRDFRVFLFALGKKLDRPAKSKSMTRILSLLACSLALSISSTPLCWGIGAGTDPIDAAHSALHEAAKSGDVTKVSALLGGGDAVNSMASNGWTPLHFASAFGHPEVAVILLDKGANPEALTPLDLTPLHLAAMRGHPMIVNLLLRRGSNPAAASKQGQTPLHLAANEKVVAELSPSPTLLNSLNSFGLTPLHSARHSAVARTLLDLGADLRIRTPRGLTAMQLASVESLEKDLGLSIHSVMLGRLRGLLAQMPLSVTNISADDIRDIQLTAESQPCTIVISPSQIPLLHPSERLDLALTLTRDKDLPEGDYPIFIKVSIANRPVGSIDLRVDTRTNETPEDMGMIRLAKGNLRPAGSNWHYIAYIGGPILILIFSLFFRHKGKNKA